MTSLSRLPDPPQPLPRVPGPQLEPFTPTAHADIEFIQHIGDPENITDGYVWKVRINGAEPLYALKMVSVTPQNVPVPYTGHYLV
jgi:hypothetical protein